MGRRRGTSRLRGLSRGGGAVFVGVVGVLAMVGVVVVVADSERGGFPALLRGERCTATAGGRSVDLSVEQAENAAMIAAVSVRRGLPARAATIALATAYQESGLENVEYGDRDSVGLFQQRPSQGWGTREEALDPVRATNAFYDALVKVEGYRTMEITAAAQTVQRSAYPEAYADHEAEARVLASALTGNSAAGLVCEIDGGAEPADPTLTKTGLTARADRVRAEVLERFGDLPLGGFAPGGVAEGHIPGSAHYEGRAVDIFFRPISPANQRQGWAVASYLMAHADRLGVETLIFDDRIWTAGDDSWRDYDAPDRPGDQQILEHRDHVHVDVFE